MKATRREWVGLGVLALPCLLYSMDLTVLLLALPALAVDLQPSATQLLWIVDIYGFLVAGLLVTMGTLGDRIGRRRLLMFGAAAFGVASVVAAFAPTAELLIAARALLGVAAATLAPSTLSLLRNMFHDEQERSFAIGVWVASFSAGGALGPVVGGLMLEWFWWGSVFLLAVPVMIALLLIGPVLLPESKDPDAGRLDFASVVLSLAAILPVIWGLKRLAEHGPDALPFAAVAAGSAVGVLFVRRQFRLADPMLDLSLFRVPGFGACLAINVLTALVAFGSFMFIALYLQLVLGLGPLEAGLWTAPSGLVFAGGAMLAPAMVKRVPRAPLMAACFALAAAAFLGMSLVSGEQSLWVLMGGFYLFCLGLAPVATLATDLIIGIAPPERAGAAAAMSETSFELGGALGIAVLGSIVTAVYRSSMSLSAPVGLDAAALDGARESLASALAVAGGLPGGLGAALLDAARHAYVEGFVVVALVCAVLMVAAAVASATLLRRAPTGANPH
jgi:DHA2 family multidrug resistance protein-like MFS transporter